MYAEDKKVIAVDKPGIDNKLQLDINSTVRWCKTWSMTLNGPKCKVMHCGKKNPRNKCYIEDDDGNKMELETTEVEKDLGIMITAQVEAAVNRASWILGRIIKTFRFFNIKLFKKLYPTFVRPHLKFASSVWNTMTTTLT